jgi:hypothetical protein
MSRRKNKNQDAAILRTEREILHVEERILHELQELHPHTPRTASISLQFSGETTMPNNVLDLNVGQSSTGTITPLLADGVTPSGGAISNAVFSIPPDPSFSATDNADGTVTITGLAVSAAPVTGTASATVTDGDGVVSTFSTSFTVTVAAGTPPPPTATTASIAVSFSIPA